MSGDAYIAQAEIERLWKEEEEKDVKERKNEEELLNLKAKRKSMEGVERAKQAEIERLRKETVEKQQRDSEQVASPLYSGFSVLGDGRARRGDPVRESRLRA